MVQRKINKLDLELRHFAGSSPWVRHNFAKGLSVCKNVRYRKFASFLEAEYIKGTPLERKNPMKESLYNQFLAIAEQNNPLHKETYMFTPEIMHFCRWLQKHGRIADLARLERMHVYDYYRYVDTKSEMAQSPHYTNAHRFGAQLVCTLLFFNKVTAENFAKPKARHYCSPYTRSVCL